MQKKLPVLLLLFMVMLGCINEEEKKVRTIKANVSYDLYGQNLLTSAAITIYNLDNTKIYESYLIVDNEGIFNIDVEDLSEDFKIVISNNNYVAQSIVEKYTGDIITITPLNTGIVYMVENENISIKEATENILLDIIINYKKHTLEEVYGSEELRVISGIYDKNVPTDYDAEFNYIEENYKSLDDTNLSGWYIKSKNIESKKCIAIFHGRDSNRLNSMKMLELIKKADLVDYNIFIPDLRNSGNSDEASTYLGYKYAEDVYSSVKFLKEKYGQEEFVLQGFSMGAMGVAYSYKAYDYKNDLNVKIDKIILDSPLADVYSTIYASGLLLKVSNEIITSTIEKFNFLINKKITDLKLNKIFNNIDVPVLILQSEIDTTTPYSLLIPQIQEFKHEMVTVETFECAEHVHIWEEYQEEYSLIYTDFIRD